jgi:hypothetical protein
MSYLYKRSNRFWHFIIRHDMTHAVWSPLVELTRRRHVQFRQRLARRPLPSNGVPPPRTSLPVVTGRSAVVVSAGV